MARRASPPPAVPDEKFLFLIHDLEAIQSGDTKRLSDGLRSLVLVLKYLGDRPEMKPRIHLLLPIYAILRELIDIDQGSQPGALLRPLKVKRRDKVAVTELKVNAAACAEHLMQNGLSRLESASFVAEELARLGIRYPYKDKMSEGISAKRVAEWRTRVKANPSVNRPFVRFLSLLVKRTDAEPETARTNPTYGAKLAVRVSLAALNRNFPTLQIGPP